MHQNRLGTDATQVRAAGKLHATDELGLDDVQSLVRSGFAARTEAKKIGAANRARFGASCQGLQYVDATAHTTVENNLNLIANGGGYKAYGQPAEVMAYLFEMRDRAPVLVGPRDGDRLVLAGRPALVAFVRRDDRILQVIRDLNPGAAVTAGGRYLLTTLSHCSGGCSVQSTSRLATSINGMLDPAQLTDSWPS